VRRVQGRLAVKATARGHHVARARRRARAAASVVGALVAGVLAMSGGRPLRAEDAVSVGLALDEVLRTTVAFNPDIQIADQQAEAARGALLAAATPFD